MYNIRKITMYKELYVEPHVELLRINSVLRNIILSNNYKNSPYYKGSDLWAIDSGTFNELKT